MNFCQNWATCQLLRQIGNPAVHPEVQTILKLHDGATKVDSALQLAQGKGSELADFYRRWMANGE